MSNTKQQFTAKQLKVAEYTTMTRKVQRSKIKITGGQIRRMSFGYKYLSTLTKIAVATV